MDIEAIRSFLDTSPTVRLLKADQGAFVLWFLQQTFKEGGGEAAVALAQDEVQHRLTVYQDQLHGDGLEVLVGSPLRYLLSWSDAGWLRRFLSAQSTQPHYQLTRYAEDAIRFVDSALTRDTRMVGTESRLRLVIDTLVDVVRGASADPDRRLEQLLSERTRIDAEIEAIRGGAKVQTYHPAQIRERFHTAIDLLKTLQGDFRAVEDRFEQIARQVQRDSQNQDRTRGEILAEALDAEDLLKEQDEGVSFMAFVSFLFSPHAQAELRKTIIDVTQLEAIADEQGSIDHVRQMVPSLLAEADNVLRQTSRLSHTLRRLLDADSSGHRQRTAEVLRDIRTLAAKLRSSVLETSIEVPNKVGLNVETTIEIHSPLARPFWTPPQVFDITPEVHELDLRKAEREGRRLARMKRLEWTRMRERLRRATTAESSLTMSRLVELWPPKAGVVELMGWLQIAHEDGHRIDRDAQEQIMVNSIDSETNLETVTRVTVPLVTYFRKEDHP